MKLQLRTPRRPADRSADDHFAPTSHRQRLVILLLTVATTMAIGVAMLTPHVAYLRAVLALKRAEPPRCAPDQTRGCVGGTMDAYVVPPAASAPR